MNAQFLSMTANTDFEWPDDWKPYIKVLRLFTFNFWGETFFGLPNDSRWQHLFISNIVPMIIAGVILLSFRSILTIFRYTITILCSAGFALGALVTALDRNREKDKSALALLVVSGLFLLIIGIEYTIRKKRTKKKIEEKINNAVGSTVDLDADLIDLEKFRYLKGLKFVHKKSFWRQFRNIFLGCVLLMISALFLNSINNGNDMGGGIVAAAALSGIVLLYNVFSNMSAKGRRFNTKVNYTFRKNLVKIVLIMMGILFVPVTLSNFRFLFLNSFSTFEKASCSNGQLRKLKMPFAPYTSGISSCFNSYPQTNQSIDFNFSNDFGLKRDIKEELFLTVDKTILYYSEILPYFVPGSFVICLIFTLGIPLLFYKLIKTCSKFVYEIPVLAKDPGNQWIVRATASKNCSRSLYAMFQLKWKDYKLIYLVYRLLIVSIVSLVGISAENASTVFVSLTVVHSLAFCITCYSRPYISNVEDWVSIICQGLNVLNALIAVLLSFKVNVPGNIAGPVIILTTTLPFFAIALGLYLDGRMAKKVTKDLVNRKKLSQKEIDASGPEGDFTKRKVRLADYLDIDTAELENMDMVIDKKLQDILVKYSILLILGCGFSLFIGAIGIRSHIYTYEILNGHNTQPGASLKNYMLNLEELNNYGINNCTNTREILKNNCTCVSIDKLSSINQTEVWRCNGEFENDLIVFYTNLAIK